LLLNRRSAEQQRYLPSAFSGAAMPPMICHAT
jgi:hypothetical protein